MKTLIKRTLNAFGLDVVRTKKSPAMTLLGLKSLPIRTIIDVGANTGQFAGYISKLFPEAKIYSFEPLPEPFEELRKWAEEKNRKVEVFNYALGEQEALVEILRHDEHSPSSSLLKTTLFCESLYPFTKKQTNVPVKITKLDKWLKSLANPLKPEILIKLDVQGYEEKVIKGGKETFQKAKACILEVNLDQLYEGQPTFNELLAILNSFGFRYAGNLEQTYADDGHVIFVEAVFLRWQ